MADFHLAQRLGDLENQKRQLQAYKDHASLSQSKIDALEVQNPSRAENQNILAKLSIERLANDRLAERALQDLRRLLGERSQLSARMVEAASAIDFAMGEDCFDERRFKALLDMLPPELATTSERWTAHFLGEKSGQDMNRFTVRDKVLILPETLASCHIYHAGDTILLTEEQAVALVGGRPGGPAVMTVAAHEAAPATVEKSPVLAGEV